MGTSVVKEPSGGYNLLRWIALAVLMALGAISVGQGVRNAVSEGRSQDFQWSGTHLLVQHIDPWKDYLDGDPLHAIVKIQNPNYLPLLYVFLAPLGLMSITAASAVWAGCNVVFALISGIVCGRFFRLGWFLAGVLLALELMSTPLRNTIGNGQQGLLVLMVWVLALCRRPSPSSGLITGFSYFKYSFAPPVFALVLFRIGWRAALLSVVPAVVTLLLVFAWLHGSFLHPADLSQMAVAPLKVANTGFFGGPGPNLMDALDWGLAVLGLGRKMVTRLEYILPLTASIAMIYWISRRRAHVSWELQLALLGVISVAFYRHHAYDGVVLLFPVAYCLKELRQPLTRWALGLLCYLWVGDRLFRATGLKPDWSWVPDCGVLLIVVILLYRTRRVVGEAERGEELEEGVVLAR